MSSYYVGEQPGNGRYVCQKCGEYVAELLGPTEQLPPCENCGSDTDVSYCEADQEAKISHGPEDRHE